MFKISQIKLFATIFLSILLSNCNNKSENFEVDLSNYKIPKKSIVKKINQDQSDSSYKKTELIKNKLINFKSRSEVLSEVDIGKIDPFSEESNEINEFSSIFQLTGFLKTDHSKYAFVSFLDKNGTISKDSIGGVNTELLPRGAKVTSINTKTMRLSINFENKDYIFELQK